MELMPHQKEITELTHDKDRFILNWRAGTGKTIATFEILNDWGLNDPIRNVLVITVAKDANSGDWQEQAKEYGFIGNLEVVSYNKLRVKERNIDYHKTKWDCVVVDECHHVKANYRTSKKTGNDSKRVNQFCRKASKVLGLSGSISPNNYVDTFNITRSLDANPFSFDSVDQFVETFYLYKSIPTAYGSTKVPTRVKNKQCERIMFTTFDKVMHKYFPEQMEHEIYYMNIDKPLHKTYEEVSNSILGDVTLDHLSKDQKLQQLANGFYYDNESVIILEKHKQAYFKEFMLSEHILESDKVVVVYKYQEDREQIEEVLREISIPNIITLLQVSQSEAINIQENNVMVFYSPNFSHKDFEQMQGRIMRFGQLKTPRFYLLCRKNTIEEHIYQVLRDKGDASDLFRAYSSRKKKVALPLNRGQ